MALFMTGFPGFLGSMLLPRLLARAPEGRAICLVQPRFAALARRRADELEVHNPTLTDRVEVVEGDITQPGLGLRDDSVLRRGVTEIWHLAAVYDLSVTRDLGMRVNLEGTRNVLSFAQSCPELRRLHYLSTCFVSGRHQGVFTERDLERGQVFNNHYEETKYLAEVLVQERMRAGLAATIYRPSIVVGDSTTGATQKYDGPYFVIRWILKQPRVAVLPTVGDTRAHRVNVVPRDFAVPAIAHLSGLERSSGRVYHIVDPAPPTVDELIEQIARATGRRILRLGLPLAVAKTAIERVPGVYKLMGIPSAAIDYFVQPTTYATDQAQADLEGSGLAVPPFSSYADRLVSFVRAHPEIGSDAMA